MGSFLPLIAPLLDPLLFLAEIALRLCFVVACFYFARLKGRRAWLWCPLGYLFTIFTLLPLVLLPSTEAAKRPRDSEDLEEDPAQSQQSPGNRTERRPSAGQLEGQSADAERILELSASLPLDTGREIAVLGAKLRQEQEFLAMQQEFGDRSASVTETQNRIDDLKQRIRTTYGQSLPESTSEPGRDEPREFEQLVARLYEQMGYTVTHSPRGRDGGGDLYAHRTSAAGDEEKIVVRCQHAYGSVVVLAVARTLYAVLGAEQHLTRGVLVTNGTFSPWCRTFAEGKRIELIDKERLHELLVRYQMRKPAD